MLHTLLMFSLCLICAAHAAPRVSAAATTPKASVQCSKPVGLSGVQFRGLGTFVQLKPDQLLPRTGLCNTAANSQKAFVFQRFLPLNEVLKVLKPSINPLLTTPKIKKQDQD